MKYLPKKLHNLSLDLNYNNLKVNIENMKHLSVGMK